MGLYFKGRLLALITNKRLEGKWLVATNELTYIAVVLITVVKCLVVQINEEFFFSKFSQKF